MLNIKFLLGLALVCLVGSVMAEEEFVAPIELDYHNAIGIPAAARIKAAEEALDFHDPKIVGGEAASLGQYPYVGGLLITLNTGNKSVCSSSLLSNTRAVTAAHCVISREAYAVQVTIVLGSTRLYSGGTRVTTSDVEVHANYNMNIHANDVAIIGFEWVTYTDSQIDYNQFLSHVQVQVITNTECQATYSSNIQASNICVATNGGRGTCGGDSGGPLVANGQLIGITSFGHIYGCELGYPVAFSRVTAFASWIQARL